MHPAFRAQDSGLSVAHCMYATVHITSEYIVKISVKPGNQQLSVCPYLQFLASIDLPQTSVVHHPSTVF